MTKSVVSDANQRPAARCARAVAGNLRPKRGRGECRMPSGTRSLACRKRPSRTRVFTARHRKTPGIPARNGFNSLYALSPAIAYCHRRLRIKVLSSPVGPTSLRRLDASCGRQDHTISPSASAPFVLRSILKLTGDLNVHPALPCHSQPDAAASTASHPACLTIAIRPSSGTRRM